MNQQDVFDQQSSPENTIVCQTPVLGLDLDGTIDEAPEFFRQLSRTWPGKVVIITYRSDREKAIDDLRRFGIRYDVLSLVSSFDAKPRVIAQEKVTVYFDDQPEMLKHVPASVQVMLVRNEGNFCFDTRLWLFSKQTGRLI